MTLEKIRRDFAKHRAKTAILCVLGMVMVGLFVKAGMEMRPRTAAAALIAESATAGAEVTPEAAAEAEARIHQSRDLWKVLRETHGTIGASAAFKFDPGYFPLDPNRPIQSAADRVETIVENPAAPRVSISNEEIARGERISETREQAKSLIVKSTVVGNGNSRPVAVVNQQILTVGDRISGFEIVSIRAREVEFKKDGITLAVKMADDASAQ